MLETPEEREVFSAMEQSSVRKEIIRTTREEKISKPGVYEKSVAMPNYLDLMEELALARVLIRRLGDRLAKLENKQTETLKLALEALGAYMSATDSEEDAKAHNLMAEAFFKIKEALAQPEQEGGVCGRCGGWVSDPVITQPEQKPATYSAWGFMGGDKFVNKDSLNRNIT